MPPVTSSMTKPPASSRLADENSPDGTVIRPFTAKAAAGNSYSLGFKATAPAADSTLSRAAGWHLFFEPPRTLFASSSSNRTSLPLWA